MKSLRRSVGWRPVAAAYLVNLTFSLYKSAEHTRPVCSFLPAWPVTVKRQPLFLPAADKSFLRAEANLNRQEDKLTFCFA